jgi:rieske iron-sulfur protein
MSTNDCLGNCAAAAQPCLPRRRVIRIAAAAGVAAGLGGMGSGLAQARPAAGDRLVVDGAEGAPKPIKASDLVAGKPVLAFPFDAATKTVRDDSRLNKVVLIKFADSELDAESKQRAAGGVLAFSAICTHQACDVKTWIANDKALVCFCHASKFLPLQAGKVADGPAPRALAALPLTLKDDQLVVAGAFSARVGPS